MRATKSVRQSEAISQTSPLIIGHRGASAFAPENTLAAFARALDDGADGLELDVRLAKDGAAVVTHDATLRRTGLTSGEVARMTSAQLAKVNAGSWFNRAHPTLARDEYEQQRVATLTDVFQLLRDKPGVIYVELKTDGADSSSDLVRAVADAIVHFGFHARVVVVSFKLPALATIKSLNPSIRTGALFAPQRRPNVSWRADSMLAAATDCGADELLPHRLLARPKLIEKARDQHLPVVVWTVDDQSWVSRAGTLGIHALITNNPAQLLNV
ncbi:MAG TPA: glycerophosphodiester phosphodiesterase family protein [Pyrinomonadaceae bacterium]|nr:glycerophosphodiester phosphodiesterase family protein [Pyrinomonadaceae bacterium]